MGCKRSQVQILSSRPFLFLGDMFDIDTFKNTDYYKDFLARSIYRSNRIEGSTLSYADTYAIIFDDDSFTLSNIKPREVYEAINLKCASDHIFKHIDDDISVDMMIDINSLINKISMKGQVFVKHKFLLGEQTSYHLKLNLCHILSKS